MTPTPARIIARLRQGPLSGTDWRGLCASAHALHVHIWSLRKAGHKIASEGRAGMPGRYTLKEDEE